MRLIRLHFVKGQPAHGMVGQKAQFLLGRFHLWPAHVVHAGGLLVLGGLRPLDHEADGHTGLDAKHVVFGTTQLGVGAHIATQVHHVDVGKLLRHGFAETIEGAALDKTAVGDKGQHTVFVQPVAGPAEEAGVHVVELGLLRGALSDVGLFDALVDVRVFAVLVVVVLVGLVGVVRRVANDDADAPPVLPLDTGDVFFRDAAEQIGVHTPGRGVQAHVVQRVHKAQAGEFFVLAGDGGVSRFNVQVGHVVGQDGHFVGVQLVLVFLLQLFGLAAKVLQQFADEGARASGRVEDVHILVDQVFAKVLFAQPVGPVDHEAHDLVGRVDHAQPVRSLGVVDLVEVLVNDLQEGLLFAVAADLRSGGADGSVVGFQTLECLLFERACEEGAFQRIQLARHVVVLVEVAVVKHLGEDFFGQDVLDQHLAHIGVAQRGVDGLLRMQQELVFRRTEAGVLFVFPFDHFAQRLQHGGQVGLELLHRRPKTRDLGPLETEEQLEQFGQGLRVGHVAAQDFGAVLPEHGNCVVAEDDVVLRITPFELLADFFVQVIVGVFGFPVAQRHAQLVQ